MMRSRYAALVLLSFSALVLSSFSLSNGSKPYQKQVLRRIVIDPGHGGHDNGARGRYSNEKDIALAVALKLEQALHDELPDVDVVLTRRSDIYHSVVTKASIANQAKGDLFVCIHANSADPITHKELEGHKTETYYKGKGKKRKKYTRRVPVYRYWHTPSSVKGTETFIYGVGKTEQRKEAASEGLDESLDSISRKEIQALEEQDANDPTKRMLASVMTQQYFQRSAKLALTIEDQFQQVGRISREAKQRQKGIWVLQAVSMPAVLVETGFISNPEEEDYLNSATGQQEIADVITRSIKIYKSSLEKQLRSSGSNSTQQK